MPLRNSLRRPKTSASRPPVSAGFDAEDAVQVQTSFTRFVLALISFETSQLPALSEEQREQKARRTRFEIESLPPAKHPNLIEAAPYIATPYDPDRNFAQALELLKAGIESQLRSSSGVRSRKR
jgi:hypothetical protein